MRVAPGRRRSHRQDELRVFGRTARNPLAEPEAASHRVGWDAVFGVVRTRALRIQPDPEFHFRARAEKELEMRLMPCSRMQQAIQESHRPLYPQPPDARCRGSADGRRARLLEPVLGNAALVRREQRDTASAGSNEREEEGVARQKPRRPTEVAATVPDKKMSGPGLAARMLVRGDSLMI